jgi:hypothetical protein
MAAKLRSAMFAVPNIQLLTEQGIFRKVLVDVIK